jgi:hypothetical protein
VKAVTCQSILTPQDLYPAHFRHDNHGAAHSAVRASAAADRIEAVAELRLETHRTAMALTGPYVRVAHHVACVSCSDRSTPVLVAETDLDTNVSLEFTPGNPLKMGQASAPADFIKSRSARRHL